ncbi:MAG: LysR family transcriptional regulator [Pseudomonadota bacterium]
MPVSPTRPKGPPLNALRAFEAAARHNSFVAAADELSVTPGAISQHVKTLEHWAGVSLFRRHAKGIEITPAARALIPAFVTAFDALASATQALRSARPNTEIHIAALPAVAQLWLPRRLERIRAEVPDLNLSVTALERPPRLARELFDLSLFLRAPEDTPDQVVLEDDTLTPVCSPRLAARIDAAQPLGALPRLHDRSWQGDWARWLAAAELGDVDPIAGPHHSLYSLAVEEAKASAGLLMGHSCLIDAELRAGSLVRVSDVTVPSGLALVLELPPAAQRRPEVVALADALAR